MLKCELSYLHEVEQEIKSLSSEHYCEAVKQASHDPVDIDWDFFNSLSKQNACFAVALRKGKELVGYSVFTVSNDPFRKNIKEATNVCLYVKKAFRGVGTLRLLVKSADFMKDIGAKKTQYLVKNKALIRLLKRIGHKEEEQLLGATL